MVQGNDQRRPTWLGMEEHGDMENTPGNTPGNTAENAPLKGTPLKGTVDDSDIENEQHEPHPNKHKYDIPEHGLNDNPYDNLSIRSGGRPLKNKTPRNTLPTPDQNVTKDQSTIEDRSTVDARQSQFHEFMEEQSEVLFCKGHDYTAGESQRDVYYNFKKVAELLDGAPITPYTVAMVYFLKHIFSIITFAKTGVQESGEGLRGRHIDIGNYNFILDQLADDHEECFKEDDSV